MRKVLLVTAIAAFLVTGAQAHMGATGVVLERMEAMKSIASAVKAIKGQLTSDNYSSTVVSENAALIEAHSGKAFTKLFPKGSEGAPSEASPLIWKDWGAFEKIADDLKESAGILKGVASDQASLKEPFTNMLKTCGACHKKFREKLN
ncbi:MAG: cytochrome c [Rhodospirillales bacterium]